MIGGSRHKVVQGPAGLAASYGLGCVVPQTQQEISQRRFVWTNKPVAPFISFRCSKHSGRSWTRKLGNFCAVHAHRPRITKGNRDTYYSGWQAGTWEQNRVESSARFMRGNRKNATLSHSRDLGKEMTSLIPIRYSLLTIRVLGVAL
jgi:hypothetical protein